MRKRRAAERSVRAVALGRRCRALARSPEYRSGGEDGESEDEDEEEESESDEEEGE